MALIKCTECENMISEYATACPYCGCPMSIIIEKSKTEQNKTVIEKKITAESVDDLVKYRSLCKIPKEIVEQNYCYELVENVEKDKTFAEEAKRIDEIKAKEKAERLEQECQDEIARKKAEEARRKRIKKIAVACGVAVVGLAIIVMGVILPSMKENNASEENYVQKEESVNEQEKMELLKSAEVGDCVSFGTYEQDNNFANGKEEIEWRVLAKEEDRILLLSEYALDCKSYHETLEDITWEECTLRSWLNEEFFNVAFSDEEETMIPTVTVSADKNPKYDTDSGNATEDKVFLLSIKEVEKYLDRDTKMCESTKYANARGVYKNSDNGCVWWWLRSSGRSQDYAAGVRSNGGIGDSGNYVHYGIYAVRPALWIELNS